jgi:hypothetical protein
MIQLEAWLGIQLRTCPFIGLRKVRACVLLKHVRNVALGKQSVAEIILHASDV